jgi:cytochrome c553
MSSRLFVTVFTAVGICCTGAANSADVQALVQACAACHGESGLPADPKTTPIIWGQQASYLY